LKITGVAAVNMTPSTVVVNEVDPAVVEVTVKATTPLLSVKP
jgi:hypothetical protein